MQALARDGDQCRLAITTFDEAAVLWRTVSALLQAGLQIDQLCLVALESTMASIEPIERTFDGRVEQVAALCRQVSDWRGFFDSQSVVATSGQLRSVLQSQRSDGQLANQIGGTSAHLSDFVDQIKNGSIALAVRSSDAQQHISVTRTLLAKSTHKVTTFSFMLSSREVPTGNPGPEAKTR